MENLHTTNGKLAAHVRFHSVSSENLVNDNCPGTGFEKFWPSVVEIASQPH
jgi:hypothetical protein